MPDRPLAVKVVVLFRQTGLGTAGDLARDALRAAPPIAMADLPTNGEYALVLTRRGADGVHQPVAVVADDKMLDRAIRRAAPTKN